MIERAKWSEDDDEWILPYVKRKSIDGAIGASNGNGKMLPDIFGQKQQLNSYADSDYNTNYNNSNGNKMLPDIFGQKQNASALGGGGGGGGSDMDFLDGGLSVSPRSDLGLGVRGTGLKPVTVGTASAAQTGVSLSRPGSAAKDLVPMLMLGGAAAITSAMNNNNNNNGEGIAGQEKKKKKKKKKPKAVVDKVISCLESMKW